MRRVSFSVKTFRPLQSISIHAKSISFFLALLPFNLCWSHPVIYKGGFEIISNQSENHHELTLAQSLTNRFALAASYQQVGDHLFRLGRAQFLLYRANQEHSQGNAWLILGTGQEQNPVETAPVHQIQWSVDWESRKNYFMFEHSYLNRKSAVGTAHIPQHANDYKARWGFAPYIGQYDELNIWFMAQFENKAPVDRIELIPFLRFYYKEVLWELGQGFDGHSRFQFMLHL